MRQHQRYTSTHNGCRKSALKELDLSVCKSVWICASPIMAQTVRLRYDTLPNVYFDMEGDYSENPNVDTEDDTKRSHFEQEFNWRINQDAEEFVIRISRKPGAAARHGQHTNVAVKIQGGLTQQPDGSVVFDGGVGNKGVSTFGLSFKISQESEGVVEEEPEEREVAFFDHSQHKLLLAPERFHKDNPSATCDACVMPLQRAKWLYRCPPCNYDVHAACAQLPRRIRHPSHHQHSLKLLKFVPGVSQGSLIVSRTCDVCKGKILLGLHYYCDMCDFDAHTVCPAPSEKESSQVKEVQFLDHSQHKHLQQAMMQRSKSLQVGREAFSQHKHLLATHRRRSLEGGDGVVFIGHPQHKLLLAPQWFHRHSRNAVCDACMGPLQATEWLYRCAPCGYDVHAACVQLPQVVQHPSHYQHPLKLIQIPRGSLGYTCDVCRGYILQGLLYKCAICDFDAHLVCPASTPDMARQIPYHSQSSIGHMGHEALDAINNLASNSGGNININIDPSNFDPSNGVASLLLNTIF